MDGGNDELFLPHHVKIMKVAFALAIIRQKPEGVSAREYTERLALQFNDRQDNWKERATILERELLRTRQELLKFQITDAADSLQLSSLHPPPAHSHPSHPHPSLLSGTQLHPLHTQVHHLQSQALLGSQESGYSSSQQGGRESSLIITEEGRERRRHILSMTNGASNFTDGGTREHHNCNGGEELSGVVQVKRKEDELQKRIKAHVQFCSSVSSLVCAQHQLSNVMTSDLRVTLRDTILDATQGLTEAIRKVKSPFPLPQDVVDKAAKCIVDCIRMPLMAPFEEDLTEATEALISTLLERMTLQRTATKEFYESVHSLIHILCGVPKVFEHTVVTMAGHVTSCAQSVLNALENCSLLDSDAINNTGALLRILDSLLQTYEASAVFSEDVRCKVIEDLESSLVGLSESLPLFTYAVWKVIAQLSLSDS